MRHMAPGFALRALLIPPVRRRAVNFMSELGIRYTHSPLSVNGGDRAPDGTFRGADGTTCRLFDLFRSPGHTALLFPGDTPRLTAAAERITHQYGADVAAHIIAEPNVRAKYGVPHGGLVLVRPDGYIGFRATATDDRSIAAMLADLARRFGA
jgi:hypothetical protein